MDVGSRDPEPVRKFATFTADLHELADWLNHCGIDTVAMESTGVYWIPICQILESNGIEVVLVNARHTKNVTGRKTDMLDCQWLRTLHSYGLLAASFRPARDIGVLRCYIRHRQMLIEYVSAHVQHMQKALTQMNRFSSKAERFHPARLRVSGLVPVWTTRNSAIVRPREKEVWFWKPSSTFDERGLHRIVRMRIELDLTTATIATNLTNF